MSPTCSELLKRHTPLLEAILGNENVRVESISPIENIEPGSLVFAAEKTQLESALASPASVIVTKTGFVEAGEIRGKTVVLTKNVGLAHARLTAELYGRLPCKSNSIHSTAQIAKSARLGKSVSVGAFAVIGENTVVGDEASVGPHCILEDGSKVGARTVLWAQVYVGAGCAIGADCVIHPQVSIGAEGFGFAHDEKGRHHRIPQRGIVVIEDRAEIGSLCTIDRATFSETRVGSGTKIDTHVHIAHNCTIGRDCLITAGLVMGGSSHIGNNVVMGGNVTVSDHVRIADNVQLGGLSGVAKDIEKPGAYGGYPLQQMKDYLRTTSTMVHLVEMRKNIHQLMLKLKIGE